MQGMIALLLLSLFHLSKMHVKPQLQKGKWQVGSTARGQSRMTVHVYAGKAIAAILSQIHFVGSAFGQGLLMLLSIHGCMGRCGMSCQVICQSQDCCYPTHDNL